MRATVPDSPARSRTVCGLFVILAMAGLSFGPCGWAAEGPTDSLSGSGFHWNTFVGPFHIVLLHFPIGFIAAAAAMEFFAWRRPSPELRFAVRLLLWIAVASGVAASATGLLRASEGGFEAEAVLEHRNLAFAFVGTTLAAAMASHFAGRSAAKGGIVLAFRGLLLMSLLLVGTAGHHGGNLTHGSDFLTAGAPQFIVRIFRPALQRPPSSAVSSGNTNTLTAAAANSGEVSSSRLYTEIVKPLFETRCYACHGPEKHKGDYRLDVPDIALRGGESGSPGITPGDPMKSHVLRLLLLPRDHDDAMPPEGKQAASPEEILAVARWIQAGAPFDSSPASAPP